MKRNPFVSSQSKARDRRGRRWLNRRVVPILVTGVAAAGAAGAIVADAAPPAFPDNVVVFPDRDFITIEGYQSHIGETGLVEVTRDGKVIGSAKGVVEEGDVAFEVNHPGGYCWGAGTGLNVTPDIRPGDKATISFNGIEAGDTVAGNAYVTEDMILTGSPTKNTVVVHGYAGPGVNQAQMEVRVINPDLVDTEVGKRDIRAVTGPLVAAPKGAYSSSLEFEGNQFTATFVFQDPANALIASKADLGERAMSWQVEDADGNRQGLTIAEFGEAGGPGMGGCPAGPGDSAAPTPGTATVQRSTDKTSASVTWAPADALPGTAAVTGYSVEAIKQTPSSTGEKEIIGKRAVASATHVNLDGLSATQGYDVEVRSMTDSKMSSPFTVQVPAPSDLGDVTAPKLTVSPANTAAINTASNITLSSEAGADIYYTIDGTPAVEGGLPTDTAKHYLEPIALSGQVTLHAAVFDRAGNFDTFTGVYKPATDTIPAPAAVSAITGSAGQASVTLSWASPEAGVTGYGIQAYVKNTAGARVASGALLTTTAKTITIGSLNPGTEYYFTVKAKNASGYGPESTDQGPFVPTKLTDTVTIGTAKWKSGDFRVTGSGSAVGAFLEVHAGSPTGALLARGQVEPPVAPATNGTYDIRARASNAPASNPGKIYVVSENGGVAGPFTVAG
jgi:hypothetical protein